MRIWTSEELNYIRENHGKITYKEMVGTLNRTEKAIQQKASQLNISKKQIRKHKIVNQIITLSEDEKENAVKLVFMLDKASKKLHENKKINLSLDEMRNAFINFENRNGCIL